MIIAGDARFGRAAGDNQGNHEYRQYSVHDHSVVRARALDRLLDKVDLIY